MACFSKSLLIALCVLTITALTPQSSQARLLLQERIVIQQPEQKEDKDDQTDETDKADQGKEGKKDKKKKKRAQRASLGSDEKEGTVAEAPARSAATRVIPVDLVSDHQSRTGDIIIAEGYVNATQGEVRLQADRATFNTTTGDMVAEGNVIFDQGDDQRVTARRAEINWTSKKATFWDTTGFTNHTQTGEYLFYTAERVEKTGPQTYELINASVTACEDVEPKWRFSAERAELKMGDRVKLHDSTFYVRGLPAFYLPYAWIPATKKERKSGFLLPITGNSNQKGRILKTAYYQTLGQSADITIRNDLYTSRGLGFGAEFRAQTDQKSYIRMGVYTVKDRLFGEPGDDQGGTAFVTEAVQYLPHGWLAVADVSLVSSLQFRQVFSDNISDVIDPRRESTFYLNNNTGNFSFNFLAANETTTIFRPSSDPESTPTTGTNFDIKIRQAPEINLTSYPKRILDRLPIYYSFEATVGSLKREESVAGESVLITPASVQRFDLQSKITAPLATFAGVAITPSLSLRETYYSNRLDPSVPVFNPETFALNPGDPRLDPAQKEFNSLIKIFDPASLNPVTSDSISRHYGEFDLDIRPPALEKDYLNPDGSERFKHVIEPYITYRKTGGIGEEFEEIIRFDERDAIANTNEFEYAVVNRFFIQRSASDIARGRIRKREDREPSEMEIEGPEEQKRNKRRKDANEQQPETTTKESENSDLNPETAKENPETEGQEPGAAGQAPADKKQKIETGDKAELNVEGKNNQTKRARGNSKNTKKNDSDDDDDDDDDASNLDAPPQAYEFLSVKVAQKYFFDRNFGGALIAGRRNQFYPINTLTGFSYGGRARSFSPLNVQVRYRPLSSVYADLRMDIGSEDKAVRNVIVGGGFDRGKFSVAGNWYLSRKIEIAPNSFEPGTFAGNQVVTTVQYGKENQGFYGGTRIGYDFTDRFLTGGQFSKGRLRYSRSYFGYGWDCCGVQFNYNTFKAGLRNESAFSFTFSLAGLGAVGTDQFSQLGNGIGNR